MPAESKPSDAGRGLHSRLPLTIFQIASPVLFHFLFGQVLAYFSLWITSGQEDARESYMGQVMTVTGLTGILVGIILIFLYRRDQRRRKETRLPLICKRIFPSLPEVFLLLLMGAGLGQYMNLLIGMLSELLPQGGYYEEMAAISDGKSLAVQILWMGIAAPFGEEMVFRILMFLRMREHMRLVPAALLNGLLFGIYHGSVIQGIYAGLLGFIFALLLEWSGCLASSILLHIAANCWPLIMEEYAARLLLPPGDRFFVSFSFVLLLSIFWGLWYFRKKWE